MHAKEAKIMARAQARHDESLFSLSWSRFFENILNFVKPLLAWNQATSNGAVVWQLALMSGLHCRKGAVLSGGNFHQLLCATFLAPTDVKMIAYEEQKSIRSREALGTIHSMAITQRCSLLDKFNAIGVRASRCRIGCLVAGPDDDADFLDTRLKNFLDYNRQGGFCDPVA